MQGTTVVEVMISSANELTYSRVIPSWKQKRSSNENAIEIKTESIIKYIVYCRLNDFSIPFFLTLQFPLSPTDDTSSFSCVTFVEHKNLQKSKKYSLI